MEYHLNWNYNPCYSFIFILDDSGSMEGKPWNDLKSAVSNFLSKKMFKREYYGFG